MDTWDPEAGNEVEVSSLVQFAVNSIQQFDLDGITISGGEPFQQPEALYAFSEGIRAECPGTDLLVYSGYTARRLQLSYSHILRLLDAVISEPFVASNPTNLKWRGSANQRLLLLSLAAQERYSGADDPSDDAVVQIGVDSAGLWVLGIPRRGGLPNFESRLLDEGVRLEDVSWRA